MTGELASFSSRSTFYLSESCSPVSSKSPKRSMEEVWKDISLNTLHQDMPSTPSLSHHHHHNYHQHRNEGFSHTIAGTKTSSSFRGLILQDFLSGTLKEPSSAVPPPDIQHPPTALSLNFGHFFGGHRGVPSRGSSYVPFFTGAHPDGSDGFPAPAAELAACCAEKRPLEQQLQQPDGDYADDVDRRKKRMIKNRESAARSRARKQAYTYELELEVAQLAKENRKLERQCQELRAAMAAQTPAATKNKLQRTSSAPF